MSMKNPNYIHFESLWNDALYSGNVLRTNNNSNVIVKIQYAPMSVKHMNQSVPAETYCVVDIIRPDCTKETIWFDTTDQAKEYVRNLFI